METLWAPWRMQYILGPKSGECIFCAFPARCTHREDLVLAVREHGFVCLNKYPFTAGHLLVAPKRHVADITQLDEQENRALFDLVRETAGILRKSTRCEGMNIGLNLGTSGGAGIAEHVHVHLVPRWAGDSNFMPVIADTRVMPEHLDETWKRLEPLFRGQ